MKKIFLLLFLVVSLYVNAQVAINTDGSLPDNSAMLDVKSTAKGMLVPRMTAVQRDAIASPATGLLVFCTDNNLFCSNKGTPASPSWVIVNSQWVNYGSNISFIGGKVGIGNASPATILDITGGNNWDVVNGEGDFRIGNSQYRLRMGIALGGGGAGATGIMQYGQPGGYNVLSLGAQGHKLLYLNGETQGVGIGTDAPMTSLDIQGTLRISDGSEAAGKILTSDVDGIASWSGGPHYIGETYGGGKIFYVYEGGKHGLIAATADQSAGVRWYGGSYTITRAKATGIGSGKSNTAIIIANQGPVDGGTFAATVCNEYSITLNGVTYVVIVPVRALEESNAPLTYVLTYEPS